MYVIKLYLNTHFIRPWSFTNMLKNKQPMPVNIRATMQQQQQLASARNRRLAQQMENRPSVQAALKLKQVRESGIFWGSPLMPVTGFSGYGGFWKMLLKVKNEGLAENSTIYFR